MTLTGCILPYISDFNTNGNDNRTATEILQDKDLYILSFEEPKGEDEDDE